jgi:prevent-host-death family protein
MTTVKIHEAKTNLSRLIARAEAGEDIIIARDDKPVVRLVKVEEANPPRRKPEFGSMKGYWPEIPDEFFFAPWTLEPAQNGLADGDRGAAVRAAVSSGRITIDPGICGGSPCIRGMRIRVSDIVGMMASGMTREKILADYPYLEPADIDAALAYAAGSVGRSVIGAD